MLRYSKTQAQKRSQRKSDATHGKRINIAASINKALKKSNPNETTIVKRKKGVFVPSRFTHFKEEATKMKHDAFLSCHEYPEFIVDIETKTLSKKLCQHFQDSKIKHVSNLFFASNYSDNFLL